VNKFAIGTTFLGLTSVVAADMSRPVQKDELPTIIIIPSHQSRERLAYTSRVADIKSQAATHIRGFDTSATATIPSFDAGFTLRQVQIGRLGDARHWLRGATMSVRWRTPASFGS